MFKGVNKIGLVCVYRLDREGIDIVRDQEVFDIVSYFWFCLAHLLINVFFHYSSTWIKTFFYGFHDGRDGHDSHDCGIGHNVQSDCVGEILILSGIFFSLATWIAIVVGTFSREESVSHDLTLTLNAISCSLTSVYLLSLFFSDLA